MTRLAEGGQIDREKPLKFRFNGRRYKGYEGDTLASALLANGIHLVARSFKYHRPRGIVTAGAEEPSALVQVNGDEQEPNVRATTLRLTEGLNVSSINCWPSLRFDFGAVNSLMAGLIPAGFYYKTFMLGRWDRYSWFVRRAAGLGRTPRRAAGKKYEKRYYHTDLLIVGAGEAGLRAAVEAADQGAHVTLIDDQPVAGGHTLNKKHKNPWSTPLDPLVRAIDLNENITRLVNTTAIGYYDHNLMMAVQRQPHDAPWVFERLWHMRAEQIVLATGAVERPLVFSNNDLPGVMLVSAAATYANRYAVAVGHEIIVFTNNSSAYGSVFDLADAGIEIVAIVDSRARIEPELRDQCRRRSITIHEHSVIDRAFGKRHVEKVRVVHRQRTDDKQEYYCDTVCLSGGWNPLVHLHSQSGGKPVYSNAIAAFVPGKSVQNEMSIGACAGDFDGASIPYNIEPLWEVDIKDSVKMAFVDFQNDVTTSDIQLAISENFESIEHIKRYTTAGMATDQGKIGNANVIGIVANRSNREIADVGTTTYRPPFTPTSFGAISGIERGALILPARTTPITAWNIENGAAMDEAGANFRRPFWFPKTGESAHHSIASAASAVRQRVGIYDATPLGKFELHGPDADELLNRLYTNRFDDLDVWQGRFGLMLREDGRLLDDGVSFRVDDHWLMTCGTGAASSVLAHIERLLQTEWTDLQVYIVNVTSQWSNICVCGPLARQVLNAAEIDINIDEDGDFKFMQMREANIAGFQARIARVSYTGELSFEINVRRSEGLDLWETLMEAGQPWDITPVGSESSNVLRIEKGFISASTEGDNITNPFDAGLGWLVDMDKGDFVGRRSLLRDLALNLPRQQVVGLLPDDADFVPSEGSALLPKRDSTDFQGHVTASCYSPTLGCSIALALLKNGKHRYGESVVVSGLSRSITAEVTAPVFYDPRGERMRA